MQTNTVVTLGDTQHDDDNLENLPSIINKTYSSCKRPRRNARSQIPKRFWNSFMRCIEYPDGVFIDNNGQHQPNKMQEEDEDEISDEEFEKLPPAKKQKILHNLKRQKEKEELEEQINLEYDRLASIETYDEKDLDIDPDFIDHIKGDEEYLPSSCNESESEYDSHNSESDNDEGDDISEDELSDNDGSENNDDPDDDDEFEGDESDGGANEEIVDKL
jgi:hypothetical protein